MYSKVEFSLKLVENVTTQVMLLGHSDSYVRDKQMQVTIAYNHFGEGLIQRMPRYCSLLSLFHNRVGKFLVLRKYGYFFRSLSAMSALFKK